MEKETLEEAAERHANQFMDGRDHYYGFKEGAKWQAKRMYSEEDLKLAFEGGELFIIGGTGMGSIDKEDFADWFKQFKKK